MGLKCKSVGCGAEVFEGGPNTCEKCRKKGISFGSVISCAGFIVSILAVQMVIEIFSPETINNTGSVVEIQQIIEEGVLDMKNDLVFPIQVDAQTKLNNVTARQNAIRFHYVASGIDPSTISAEVLKEELLLDFCAKAELSIIVQMGVPFEYEYVFEGYSETYLTVLSKEDCD